jgi:hypothetical protein
MKKITLLFAVLATIIIGCSGSTQQYEPVAREKFVCGNWPVQPDSQAQISRVDIQRINEYCRQCPAECSCAPITDPQVMPKSD